MDRVLYEMHVGTFTEEGTWAAAARELPRLADLGITVIEMMPICEFAGRFGWGYDGVDLFAPTRLYGTPDDLRGFIDRAHALGVAVILDVVYNHFGPDGNYLARFAEGYFSHRHRTDWGEAIAFDGAGAGPVRELFVANARYWIEELHFDGLRVDATQDIHDDWEDHILARVTREVRAAARGRATLIVGENEPQERRLLLPTDEGGAGFDSLWNDDFHHTAMVAATGRSEAYYQDYRGTPQELISALKWGFLYQGQWYAWQAQPRGTFALDRPASAFRTTIRWPTPREVPGWWSWRARPWPAPSPRRGSSGRRRRCSSRGRSTARARRSSTSPTTRRSWRRWCSAAGVSSWGSSPRSRRRSRRPRSPTPARRRRSSGASSTPASGSGTHTGRRCTAISWRCGAIRCSPGSGPIGCTAPCWGPTRSRCASSTRSTAIGWSW
jgi:hypothetical protein